MKKTGKIWLTVGCILLALIIFLSVWFFGATYPQLNATWQFSVPGLKSGFVPQGLCRMDDLRLWLISGYMADGSASRIYVVNGMTGEAVKYFTVKDGTALLDGHFGGVACNGDDIWLASEGVVYHFYTSDVQEVVDARSVVVKDKFDSCTNADFCFANDEIFVVGEFDRNAKYSQQSHHLSREDGMVNTSIALVFKTGNGKYGLETDAYGSLSPVLAYSVPDKIQGFCMVGSKIVLSASYALASGTTYVFDGNIASAVDNVGTLSIMNSTVPFRALWADRASQTIRVPAMCEGMDYFGNQIYMLFESASTKYKAFSRTRSDKVMSFAI